MDHAVPEAGQWPADPQRDTPIREDRIWIDGCFDFSHHGHAGAMLQARREGAELLVGVHSDEAILEHKGPTVMTLQERVAAVEACRWSTRAIPHAPYVTSLPWISHYGCQFVVHGDDITSDSNGEDCYRYVKEAGRFKVVKRTPGISTTDLVGRMLLCTKIHFIKSLPSLLSGSEGLLRSREMLQRITDYASDETALKPGAEVWRWTGSNKAEATLVDAETVVKMVDGKPPRSGQRIVYVDGGFDLFSSGHIEFLRQVHLKEEDAAQRSGWYQEASRTKRIQEHGEDFGPTFLVAGVHDDDEINRAKGLNYPIMNIFERGLCVLQCKYVNAMIFSAPFSPSKRYLGQIPYGVPATVYHGPTSFLPLTYDPYEVPKEMGIFRTVESHPYDYVNAGEIVRRIVKSREAFEERQRKKGEKGVTEEAAKIREELEEEALKKELAARSQN